MNVAITLFAGYISGLLFFKVKIPGGMLIGAIFGTVLVALTLHCAEMPYCAKFAAQVTAGTFLGCLISKDNIIHLKEVYRPLFIVISSFFVLDIAVGTLIHCVTSIDLLTALLSAIPGGISDVPLIAADMGANAPQVVVLQFLRLCAGLSFPIWIAWLDSRRNREETCSSKMCAQGAANAPTCETSNVWHIILVFVISSICGGIGVALGIPAGALLFSMVGTLLFKVLFLPVSLPGKIKHFAQVLSGTYIGCSISVSALLGIPYLLLPALIIIVAYMLNACVTGHILARCLSVPFKESMLMVTPAGGSDMALISAEIGVESPTLVVLQIIRMIIAASIFPQICYQIARLF